MENRSDLTPRQEAAGAPSAGPREPSAAEGFAPWRRVLLQAGIAAAILIWGFVFIPLKHLTNSAYTDHPVSPEGFLILRFAPLLPLLLALLFRYRRFERPGRIRRDWPWMVLMGVLMIPGYHLPLNFGLASPIHTGLMSLILNLTPALTYFLAAALGQEKMRRQRTAGILVAFLGIAAIFGEEIIESASGGGDGHFSLLGAGLCLISAFSWSAFTLIGRRLSRDHDSRFIYAAAGTSGVLAILVAAPFLCGPGTIREYLALGPLDWAAWAYASLLAAFFSYWIWVMALRRFEASRLAITGNLMPLIVHAAAVLLLPAERKAFTAAYIAGALVTLAGTALVVRGWGNGRGAKPPGPPEG